MSLSILPAFAELAINVPQPFSGFGGVEPYSYSVSGGGTIDAATGLYTAPSTPPSVKAAPIIVTVTDANGDEAEAEVTVGTPLELVCLVIQRELGLFPGRVWLWDQKINSPNDVGLFIPIAVPSCKPYSNNKKLDDSGNLVQYTNFRAMLDLHAISKDASARDMKELIVLALNSDYAQRQGELNGFRIFPVVQPIANISDIDGAAIPYHFVISAVVHYAVTKTTAAEYYDTFTDSLEVSTDPDVPTEPKVITPA